MPAQGSPYVTSEDFNETLLLTEFHSRSSLPELERGLDNLDEQVKIKTEQMRVLVKVCSLYSYPAPHALTALIIFRSTSISSYSARTR